MKNRVITEDDVTELIHTLYVAKNVNKNLALETNIPGRKAYLQGCHDGIETAIEEIERWHAQIAIIHEQK